jgi:hypothetical protein
VSVLGGDGDLLLCESGESEDQYLFGAESPRVYCSLSL